LWKDFPGVRMGDEEMVAYLAHTLMEPGRPRPSIETLLHGFVNAYAVVHTHADAIVSLTNNDGAALLLSKHGTITWGSTVREAYEGTGERAMRIAKPGLVGALLGAGLGAAGGAIADGGKAAGKGALIGGIAGAGGYGAYKTQQECGAILGNGLAGPTPASPANAPQATFGAGQEITVYNAR
jgi:hypothetical protein